jgi:hypothetical protein
MHNLLEAEQLATAAHWADLHAVLARTSALPGSERMMPLGGDGTPEVAEFAPAEYGAAIGVSHGVANRLIADALDLRHRLPQLWARVQGGEIKVWAARRIAETTRHLPQQAARQVDRVIAPYADRKSPGELVTYAEAEAIRTDPDLAKQRAEATRKTRGAWLSPETHDGIGSMFIKADATDLTRFSDTLNLVADDLKTLGDDDSHDERRAKAVGVLADPQLALDLHTQATGQDPAPRTGGLRQATLYVHLTDDTLRDADGLARVEGIGPALKSQVKQWLGHDRVTIKPVIDLANQSSVDAYEIPDRLREAVHLIMPGDTFPYATNQTRRKDIDHTVPHQSNGPPGQTAIGNLGPIARLSHRTKPTPAGK